MESQHSIHRLPLNRLKQRQWLNRGALSLASAVFALQAGLSIAAPPAPPRPAAPAAGPSTAPAKPAAPIDPSIFDDSPAPPAVLPPADPKTNVKILPPGPTTAPAPVEAPVAPVPVKGETAQQSFDRIYGPRLRKVTTTPTPTDDIILAQQMLADALQLTQSDLQQIMLRQVYDLGMRSHLGYSTALAALQNITRLYPEKKADCDDKILSIYEACSYLPQAKMQVIARLYIDKLEEMATEHLNANPPDYDGAVKLYQRSIRAEKVFGKAAAWHQQDRVRTLRDKASVFRRINGLNESLMRSPEPVVAASLVKLVLLDWDDVNAAADALPLVDEHLRAIATAAALGADALTEAQAKDLGDWYKANYVFAGPGKMPSLVHARTAYERALALHAARDVGWLEIKAALDEVQADQAVLARKIALERAAEERRDTTVITTNFNQKPNHDNPGPSKTSRSGGGGGGGGARSGGGGGGAP